VLWDHCITTNSGSSREDENCDSKASAICLEELSADPGAILWRLFLDDGQTFPYAFQGRVADLFIQTIHFRPM